MKKIKLLVVALVLLSGCSKLDIIEEPVVENVQTQRVEESKESFELPNEITVSQEEIQENIEPVNPTVVEEENEITTREKRAVDEFVNSKMLRHSNVGINIVDLSTGKSIVKYNSDKIITPASILKVVTSAAAYETLGAKTTLETKVLYTGKIDENGVLEGNLYIQGGGDPTLGSDGIKRESTAFMNEWIGKIKALGIKEVKGNIIVIDDLFGYVGVEEKWLWEDFGTSYAPGTYGISIFDNLYTLYLGSDSKKVKVLGIEPKINGLKFDNRLEISPKGKKNITIKGLPFENKRVLNGEFPANVDRYATKTEIPNPGLFLGEYFKESLKNSGIKVTGKVKTSRDDVKKPKNPKTIAVTNSVTIEEMIKVLLKRSDNHYTEHLYQLMKLQDIDVVEFWKSRGIDTGALVMCDGSGLSRGDYVSADVLTEILVYMNKNYPEFIRLLPRAGYEGTVSDILGKASFDGEARVKSGSMSGVQSYTGYLIKGDKKYAFTVIVNHWDGKRAVLKKEMEKLLTNLF